MMTPEERLRGLSPEDVFRKFSPEERLRGLSAEEIFKRFSPDEIENWRKKMRKKKKRKE